MFLSSLVDCGADKTKIIQNIKRIEKHFSDARIINIEFVNTECNGIRATRFCFDIEEKVYERNAVEMLRIISNCCNTISLSQKAKKFVIESMKTIIKVESIIHNKEIRDLHLHESASIDTAADLIGSATALDDLDLLNDTIFYTTKVAVGGGLTEFSHGTIQNPTNAILEIFKIFEIPIIGGPVLSEITTPTGAAILTGLNPVKLGMYPEFIPSRIGYGAGLKNFDRVPNILRVSIGKPNSHNNIQSNSVSVLETNIDDISGEVVGNLIEKLYGIDSRVKDVTIINGITKKNRPVYILKVICSKEIEKKIVEVIFHETGTLGIRSIENERFVMERFNLLVPIEIEDENFLINVKISKDSEGKIVNIKPEYENIREIAEKLNYPFKKTSELVNNLIFRRNLYDM